MHFPIFLGGMLLGPIHAAMVGILAPALSMGLTGMPTAAQVLRMMPELAVYGLVTSVMLRMLPTVRGLPPRIGRITAMVLAMLVAMIAGRVTYIAVSVVVTGIREVGYYAMVLVVPAIPGMIAQLVLVPPLAYKLHRLILKS
jgi:niacin transporter